MPLLEWSKFRGNKTTTRTSLALPSKYAYDSWNCNEGRQWSIAKIRKLCDSTLKRIKWTISNSGFETIKTIFYKLPDANISQRKIIMHKQITNVSSKISMKFEKIGLIGIATKIE